MAHAPTNRAFKGTDDFLATVEALRARGVPVEAVLIENTPHAECLQIKATCHVLFDQISVGVHGISAVESMFMSQPVLGAVSPWALSVQPNLPIIPVAPDTLAGVLEFLIAQPQFLREAATASREYAIVTHNPEAVAARFLLLYEHIEDPNARMTLFID